LNPAHDYATVRCNTCFRLHKQPPSNHLTRRVYRHVGHKNSGRTLGLRRMMPAFGRDATTAPWTTTSILALRRRSGRPQQHHGSARLARSFPYRDVLRWTVKVDPMYQSSSLDLRPTILAPGTNPAPTPCTVTPPRSRSRPHTLGDAKVLASPTIRPLLVQRDSLGNCDRHCCSWAGAGTRRVFRDTAATDGGCRTKPSMKPERRSLRWPWEALGAPRQSRTCRGRAGGFGFFDPAL
jgi:hypothetical protein